MCFTHTLHTLTHTHARAVVSGVCHVAYFLRKFAFSFTRFPLESCLNKYVYAAWEVAACAAEYNSLEAGGRRTGSERWESRLQ